MKKKKRNLGGHPPLDPANPLVKRCVFRLSRAMLDAIKRRRGDRTIGVVLRELIARGLEHKK